MMATRSVGELGALVVPVVDEAHGDHAGRVLGVDDRGEGPGVLIRVWQEAGRDA